MRRTVFGLVLAALALALVAGCASKPKGSGATAAPAKVAEPIVRRPDMLDHKNYKWGTQPPEWVTMNVSELEALDKFKND